MREANLINKVSRKEGFFRFISSSVLAWWVMLESKDDLTEDVRHILHSVILRFCVQAGY